MLVAGESELHELRTKVCRLGMVRAGGLTGLPAVVRELGGDPMPLIARCCLPAGVLDEADNPIPFRTGAQLLQLVARQSARAHVGVLVGLRQGLSSLGPLGALARNCPDLRSALRSLVEHIRLQDTGGVSALEESGRLASFSYAVRARVDAGIEQVYQVSLAAMVRFVQGLGGPGWRPASVHFGFAAPADQRTLRDAFDAPVRFDQPASAVVFASEWLDQPVAQADPALRALLLGRIRAFEQQCCEDEAFERLVRTLLPGGNCTAERVSELFGIHRRTLHRILARQGHTFEQMVDAIRRDAATQELAHCPVKLARLSHALGYRNPSAFTRAFRRWTAAPPSRWQTAH